MPQDTARHVDIASGAREVRDPVEPSPRRRLCLVCGKPLFAGERKTHRVACAHTRALQLQQLRRNRARS